ncbi:hypothetical protein NWF32_22100 [Pseudomonas qingdaonensis]|nr:hypothetical protein [Pseudomonas qingdaonensis]
MTINFAIIANFLVQTMTGLFGTVAPSCVYRDFYGFSVPEVHFAASNRQGETMSLSIRQALAEDIHHLTGIDAVARNDERRREQLAQAIRARECWIACEANDAAAPLGYGCLDRSFFGEYFIPWWSFQMHPGAPVSAAN